MSVTDPPHHQPHRLDDYDRALVAALASGKSTAEAAVAVGLSVPTVYRRGRRPLFKAALTEARAGLFRPAADAAVESLPVAVARLRKVLDDDGAKASDHISAAKALGDLALRFSEHVDIRASLAVLEASLDTSRDHDEPYSDPCTEPDDESIYPQPFTPTGYIRHDT